MVCQRYAAVVKPRKSQAPGAPVCAICRKPLKHNVPMAKAKSGKTCHAACLTQAVKAGRAGVGGPVTTRVGVPSQKGGKAQPKRPKPAGGARSGGRQSGEMSFAQNKRAIEAGETFRSQKPSDWRLGSSPSSAGRGLR